MTDINKKVTELFEAGSHLGHKSNRVHPRAKKYIYSVENGVSVIDLTLTVPLLEAAKEFVKKQAAASKNMLVVATKKVSVGLISNLCKSESVPFVSLKWPAGLLTNFEMIVKNVKKLEKMREEKKNGDWGKFVKHEQVKLQKQLSKLEKFYGGISSLKKLPDFLFIIDVKKEKNAVKEAGEMKVPVVAICDTNVDPTLVAYPIPGNDDSLTSIEYFAKEIIGTYTKEKSQETKVKDTTKK